MVISNLLGILVGGIFVLGMRTISFLMRRAMNTRFLPLTLRGICISLCFLLVLLAAWVAFVWFAIYLPVERFASDHLMYSMGYSGMVLLSCFMDNPKTGGRKKRKRDKSVNDRKWADMVARVKRQGVPQLQGAGA